MAASYTKISGSQVNFDAGIISGCVASLIVLPEMRTLKCLIYTGFLVSDSENCKSLLVSNVRLSQTGSTIECSQGWSYINKKCVQGKFRHFSSEVLCPCAKMFPH